MTLILVSDSYPLSAHLRIDLLMVISTRGKQETWHYNH